MKRTAVQKVIGPLFLKGRQEKHGATAACIRVEILQGLKPTPGLDSTVTGTPTESEVASSTWQAGLFTSLDGQNWTPAL